MKVVGWLDRGVNSTWPRTTICRCAWPDPPFHLAAGATRVAQLIHINRLYDLSRDSKQQSYRPIYIYRFISTMCFDNSSTNCEIIIEIQATFNIIWKENSNQSHKHSPYQPSIQTQEIMWKPIWGKPPRCSSSGMRKDIAPCSLWDADWSWDMSLS